MTDATILRTNADGKTETLRRKAGEVRAAGPTSRIRPRTSGSARMSFTSCSRNDLGRTAPALLLPGMWLR